MRADVPHVEIQLVAVQDGSFVSSPRGRWGQRWAHAVSRSRLAGITWNWCAPTALHTDYMFPPLRSALAILLFAGNIFSADDLPGPHPGDQLPPYEFQQGAHRITLDLDGYGYQPQAPLATLLVVLEPGIPGAAAADTARTAAALAARYPDTIRLVLFAADGAPPDRSPWRSA